MSNLIWQPEVHPNYGFTIYLDKDFAKGMLEAKVSREKQTMMNELGNKSLKQLNWSGAISPYRFYEDSCLITTINLGNNGVWLSSGRQDADALKGGTLDKKYLEYWPHNADTSKDAYTLMSLFDIWIRHADAFRGK